MNLIEVEVEYAHRVKRTEKSNQLGPRTIIARLKHDNDKTEAMKNSWKLKGTRIFINEDLSDQTIKKRQEKLPELKAARESGKIAYFIKDKLIIREKLERINKNDIQQLETTPRNRVASLLNVFTPPPITESATLPKETLEKTASPVKRKSSRNK